MRYNVVPTSATSASLLIQIFPRSLDKLKQLCFQNNISEADPGIPTVTVNPGNKQVLQLR